MGCVDLSMLYGFTMSEDQSASSMYSPYPPLPSYGGRVERFIRAYADSASIPLYYLFGLEYRVLNSTLLRLL